MHADYITKLRQGVKTQSRVLASFSEHRDQVRARQAHEEAKVAHEAGVDGFEEVESLESISTRFKLRRSPHVREALQEFWQAALRSMQSGGEDRADATHVDQTGYALLFERIYRTLLEEYDEDEMHSTIEDDWENDSGGEAMLSREAFCDAIFELCDCWAPEHDELGYARFIHALYVQCTDEHPSHVEGETGLRRYIWREGLNEFDEARRLEQQARVRIRTVPVDTSFAARGTAKEDTPQQLPSEDVSPPSARMKRHKAAAKRRRAAVQIERSSRGKQARKESKERLKATKDIQRIQRGKSARMEFKEKKQAAQKLQSTARGQSTRKNMHVAAQEPMPSCSMIEEFSSTEPSSSPSRTSGRPQQASKQHEEIASATHTAPPHSPGSLMRASNLPSDSPARNAASTQPTPPSFEQTRPPPQPKSPPARGQEALPHSMHPEAQPEKAVTSEPDAASLSSTATFIEQKALLREHPAVEPAQTIDSSMLPDVPAGSDAHGVAAGPMPASAPLSFEPQISLHSWGSCSSLPSRTSSPGNYPGWLFAKHGSLLHPPSCHLTQLTTSRRAKQSVEPLQEYLDGRRSDVRGVRGGPSSRPCSRPATQSRWVIPGSVDPQALASAAAAFSASQRSWPPETLCIRTPFWELEVVSRHHPKLMQCAESRDGALSAGKGAGEDGATDARKEQSTRANVEETNALQSRIGGSSRLGDADGACNGDHLGFSERTVLRGVDKSRFPRPANAARGVTPPLARSRSSALLSRPGSVQQRLATPEASLSCGSCVETSGDMLSRSITPNAFAPPGLVPSQYLGGSGATAGGGGVRMANVTRRAMPGVEDAGGRCGSAMSAQAQLAGGLFSSSTSLLPESSPRSRVGTPAAPPGSRTGTPFSQYSCGELALEGMVGWGADEFKPPPSPWALDFKPPGVQQVSSLPGLGRSSRPQGGPRQWVPHTSSLGKAKSEYVRALPRHPGSEHQRVKPWDAGALLYLDHPRRPPSVLIDVMF